MMVNGFLLKDFKMIIFNNKIFDKEIKFVKYLVIKVNFIILGHVPTVDTINPLSSYNCGQM